MKVAKTVESLQNLLEAERNSGSSIGFVATMGALHEGHLSLVTQSQAECYRTVVSIFVNPAQFNDKSDYDAYPITIQEDLDQLEGAGVDYVFLPSVEEMYPEGLITPPIDLGKIETTLEGEMRPGHFAGVAKVCYRLFSIIKPDKVYFGQKDFQQTVVIKTMVDQLDLPIEVVVCPIMREPNGLAMSSRNVRLSNEDRQNAGFLYRVLLKLKEDLNYIPLKEALEKARNFLASKKDVQIEYLAAVNGKTMEPVEDLNEDHVVCVTVVQFGGIRMLDNIVLKNS